MPMSVAIILFCLIVFIILMVWMIASEMNETNRLIIKGYGYSNALESARCFERTGLALDSDIYYLNDPDDNCLDGVSDNNDDDDFIEIRGSSKADANYSVDKSYCDH